MIALRVFDHFGWLGPTTQGFIVLRCDTNAHLPDNDVAVLYLVNKMFFGHNNVLWKDQYYIGLLDMVPAYHGDQKVDHPGGYYKLKLIERIKKGHEMFAAHPPGY